MTEVVIVNEILRAFAFVTDKPTPNTKGTFSVATHAVGSIREELAQANLDACLTRTTPSLRTMLPGSPAGCGDFNEIHGCVGRDLTSVLTITEDERQLLLESASFLNAWIDPAAILAPSSPNGFDSSVPWEKILIPLGWTTIKDFGEVALWRSPERTNPGYCAVIRVASLVSPWVFSLGPGSHSMFLPSIY
jgi:hypothetical protein